MIIETCPKCGNDLMSFRIDTYPPIPVKYCPSCGWRWEGEPEKIVRIPFGGNSPDYLIKTNLYEDKTGNAQLKGDRADGNQ